MRTSDPLKMGSRRQRVNVRREITRDRMPATNWDGSHKST